MDKRLKILFLTNCSPFPMRDGQTRRTYNVLKGLAQWHEVYLLSLYEDVKEIEPESIQHLKSFCKEVEMHPAPPKNFSLPMLLRLVCSLVSVAPYTIWRHYSRTYLERIHELTRIEKFDLIHCDILPLAYTVRGFNNTSTTLTDHDVSYLKALRMAKNSNILLKLFLYLEAYKLKKLEGKVFEGVDIGIVVSGVDKKRLDDLCPRGKFEVIENGVDTDEFKPNHENTEADTISWVGGFGHYPNREGIYYFLENIYPLIKKNINDVKLYLVGGGITDKLRKIAATDLSIKLTGYVDNPLPYIQKASLFIVPLLSGGGTRLKILEAMAAGKAIVTTTIGCEGIEGIDGEHYLIADEPGEFAKKAVQVLNNSQLQMYLGNNAMSIVKQKYDWKIICRRLNRVYQMLTERSTK
jgi:glycosyltransferase involved in cell wall biosynthesis